uniref:glycosyltransferase n=1 Tax=Clostridium sp. AM58-1XD TaxID=2292307 RepID=UPI000E507DF2
MDRNKLNMCLLVEKQPYYTSSMHQLIGVENTRGKFSLENIGNNGENLTIAVLSMNRASLTLRLMESIKKHLPHFAGEFLIGDNGSAEEEKKILKKAMKYMPFRCRLVEFDQNYGVAGGRNRTFEQVKTDWILSLDNDLYFTSNPLKQAQKDINSLGVKFLALPLLDQGNRKNGIYGGHLFVENLENRACIGIGSTFYCDGVQMDVEAPGFLCTGVPGTAAVMNKETFFAVGGFDDNMFVGFEDTEFSMRIFQQGYKVGCCGMVSLLHDHPKPEKQVDKVYEQKRFSNEKLYESAMYFEKKSGFGVWSEGVAGWVKERQKDTGLITETESGKTKIALIVDRPNWALEHIATEIEENLNHYYEFKILYETDFYNLADILMLCEDCKIIHFLWRGILTSYWGEWVQSRIKDLGMTEPDFREQYLKNKIISTEIYDHLCLDDEESHITPALFQDKTSIVTCYAVASRKIEKIYNQLPDLRLRPAAYLPDGVNLTLFQPINLERFDNIKGRVIRFGWVGNSRWIINDLKGINTIIKPAIKKLQDEGYPVELVTSDREEVIIPHYKMPEFYSGIDCYICASLHEGTPNPVLESMACGVPVISTDVGLVPECFGEFQRDYILNVRSSEALVKKIQQLLCNPQDFKKLSKENLVQIKNWNWSIMCQNFKS